MTSIGYIRQSRRADLDVALSYDAQLAAIRHMAATLDIEILSDMGRSGKAGGEYLRPSYTTLVERVRSGEISTVYVISLSRLSRSVPELHDFMTLAQSTGCAIVSDKEGKLDPTTATGKLMFNIFASFAEYVRDLQVEAAQENVALRRGRGERMGRAPYGERPGEDAQAVVAAWNATHSLNGAAKLLNEAHVRSALGRDWSGVAVRNVLSREAPETMAPQRARRGAKPSSPFLLYGLLRCHCRPNGPDQPGRILTASRDGRGNRAPTYRCHAADTLPDHPRPTRIRESEITPWIMAEAARFNSRKEGEVAERMTADDQARTKLEARRTVIEDMYETNGPTWRDEYLRRLARVDEKVGALDQRRELRAIPAGIDWTGDPKAINAVLHTYWTHVELGADLKPLSASWRLPAEWLR